MFSTQIAQKSDLSVTSVNFQTRPSSTYIVSMTTLQGSLGSFKTLQARSPYQYLTDPFHNAFMAPQFGTCHYTYLQRWEKTADLLFVADI